MTRKAVLINDLSGLGKCSLTAAIPVLSVMGIQPCPMATAVLTNQTDFESFYCKDCTDTLDFYTTEWKKLGFCPDGICTGFLSSENQVDKILSFIKSFRTNSTLILVDPVMGDDGKTYSLFTDTLGEKMKKLVSAADIVTPNLTELCILCDSDYSDLISHSNKPDFFDRIAQLGNMLISLYSVKTVIITGILIKDASGNELICNQVIQENLRFETTSPFIGESYSGTGDLISSAIFAGLLRGDDLQTSVHRAVAFIEKSLADTAKLKIPRNEGIEFEKNLSMLI